MSNLPGAELPPVMIQRDAASRLGVTARTMRNWQRAGFGPPATRVGAAVLYDRAAIEAFARGAR